MSCQRLISYIAPLLATLSLAACASGSEAISKAFGIILKPSDETYGAQLNPNLRYLRVTTEGRVILLVLGYLEPHPDGPIEVWYSAKGETICIQNGRIIRTAGLQTDWRAVRYSALPPWGSVDAAVTIHRSRDEMPGYKTGIEEDMTLSRIAPPSDSQLSGRDATALSWFAEVSQQSNRKPLPYSRYAAYIEPMSSAVIYGEQCLAHDLCLTWQRWPADGDFSYARIRAN